jgi:hypothetical protein
MISTKNIEHLVYIPADALNFDESPFEFEDLLLMRGAFQDVGYSFQITGFVGNGNPRAVFDYEQQKVTIKEDMFLEQVRFVVRKDSELVNGRLHYYTLGERKSGKSPISKIINCEVEFDPGNQPIVDIILATVKGIYQKKAELSDAPTGEWCSNPDYRPPKRQLHDN